MITIPVQFIAWFLAVAELTLAVYFLTLNPRDAVNRRTAFLLTVVGVHSFAVGQLAQSSRISQAVFPSVLLAVTAPVIQPVLLFLTQVLLKPSGKKTLWRWVEWAVLGFIPLPLLLTLLDLRLGTQLYFSGLDNGIYADGFAALPDYTQGLLSSIIRWVGFPVSFLGLIAFLIYCIRSELSLPPQTRRLAGFLLASNAVGGGVLWILQLAPMRSQPGVLQAGALIISFLLMLAYSYTGFQQMFAERRRLWGNLQSRMITLVLVVAVPLLLGIAYFIASQSNRIIEDQSVRLLRAASSSTAASLRAWLQQRVTALQHAAAYADMIGMDPERQKPVLENLANVFPAVNSIRVYNLEGITTAQSKSSPGTNVRDQIWFLQASQGVPYVIKVMPGVSPVLVIAVPVYNINAQVVGVLALFENLSAVREEVELSVVGDTGVSFVIDESNRLVLHSGLELAPILEDLSGYAPVKALRQGNGGGITFTDSQNVTWRAAADKLENEWGIVVQQPESELKAVLQSVQGSAVGAGIAGLFLLLGLVWLTVRQSLLPIQALTRTAKAITAGDLNQVIVAETSDELGVLAASFNQMTLQLKESIASLEQRVDERTRDLERRSRQLEAAAKVSKEAASIQDVRQLLTRTTHLISRNFGFYHVGIFIVDDARQYAVLQAANSEGGQRMLARGHKLRIGQVGIVGYVANTGLPRIALDVGEDAVFFNNPDLPETRSEMALPLKIHDQVIGVLDVQSTQPAAFTQEDIETLQLMADQIALALENARLLQESRNALEELNIMYGQQTRQAWRQRLRRKVIAYRYNRLSLQPVESVPEPDSDSLVEAVQVRSSEDAHELIVPLILRDQVIGSLVLRREPDQRPWSREEQNLAFDLISSVLPALEIARLVEEIQNRAQLESLAGQVSSRVQSSLDLETVVRTAVQEIGLAVNASKVQILLPDGGLFEPSRLEKNSALQRSDLP